MKSTPEMMPCTGGIISKVRDETLSVGQSGRVSLHHLPHSNIDARATISLMATNNILFPKDKWYSLNGFQVAALLPAFNLPPSIMAVTADCFQVAHLPSAPGTL